MTRANKTADEIRKEVQRILDDSEIVKEDGAKIVVPQPTPLQDLDPAGCNWTMLTFTNARGYEDAVSHAVAAVQAKWNLA